MLGGREFAPYWLERLAGLWPGRVAVTCPDAGTEYTYADLDRRARIAASGLAALGVGRGDRVATLMFNGVPLLDLLFACGQLGAILSPLNWRLNEREIRQLMTDTDPAVIIADSELLGAARRTSPAPATILAAQDSPEATFAAGASPVGSSCDAARMGDPWLILYTGGTTGTAKGALLTHESITWNCINTAVSWGLSERDIGPSFTPMFHTGGWNVFTLPLLMLGGRVILPRRFDAGAVLRLIETERPTIFFMVPTMFQRVAEQPGFDTVDFSCLRWAISGGAPLPEPVAKRWQARVPIFKQGYGLTEVGPNNFATPDAEAGANSVSARRGTVGKLTYFARARIVDDAGEDVHDGEPGELLLAGPHMCAGYWRRPEATAEAIRDGWFYTGDIARRDRDGWYYIVDRKKDMIITGGENVYPTEVESVLYEHKAVREAAVVGLPDEVWGEAVCALVSLQPGESTSEEALQAHLRQNLAGYKTPKLILIVDDLPESDASKILRAEARKLAMKAKGST